MSTEPKNEQSQDGADVLIANNATLAAVKALEFEECEDHGECEKCGADAVPLYFGNSDYWDAREGDSWCGRCVLEMHQANQRDYAVAMRPES